MADGVLVKGASARNPSASSLAGVTKGIRERARWDRPRIHRPVDAATSPGFGGANAALEAMGRSEVTAPPASVLEAVTQAKAAVEATASAPAVAAPAPAPQAVALSCPGQVTSFSFPVAQS